MGKAQKGFWELGMLCFLQGGDYQDVHSVIIPSALLMCVMDYTSQTKTFSKEKNNELWRTQAWVGTRFSHLAAVILDKAPNILELTFSF